MFLVVILSGVSVPSVGLLDPQLTFRWSQGHPSHPPSRTLWSPSWTTQQRPRPQPPSVSRPRPHSRDPRHLPCRQVWSIGRRCHRGRRREERGGRGIGQDARNGPDPSICRSHRPRRRARQATTLELVVVFLLSTSHNSPFRQPLLLPSLSPPLAISPSDPHHRPSRRRPRHHLPYLCV